MNNFKNITMAVFAAATLTSVSAGKKWNATKDAMSRHKWTAPTALVAAAVGVFNNTFIAKMAKKAKTRNNTRKANLLNSVRKSLNVIVVGALVGAAYGFAAAEANDRFAIAQHLGDDAPAPAHVVKALELDKDAKVSVARNALTQRYVAARNAQALADAKASILGDAFDGSRPKDYVEEANLGHDADENLRNACAAYDNYVAAREVGVDAEVNSHFVDQNSLMRFVRNYAPLFKGQADIPEAPPADRR